ALRRVGRRARARRTRPPLRAHRGRRRHLYRERPRRPQPLWRLHAALREHGALQRGLRGPARRGDAHTARFALLHGGRHAHRRVGHRRVNHRLVNETAPAPAPPAGEHRSPPRGASEPGAEARAASARERSRIAGRAGIVAAGTLLSRLLGLGRDLVMAAVFTRAVTDAFFVAFTLPNVLRQLLAEGAVQSAVLPVLAATRERDGDDAARRFFANVRGLSLSLLTVVTALGVAFAPALVDLFAAGYREHPEQFERTVELTRWVFPYIFLMGTAALGVAALNAYQRFAVTAFAPALLNVAFVTFSLLLPDFLGARGYDPGLALAVAVIVGGVLQVVAQWPSLAKIGFLGRPRFDFGHPGVRAVLTRMVPVLFGMGVYYV